MKQKIVDMAAENLTVNTIARRLGVSKNDVVETLATFGSNEYLPVQVEYVADGVPLGNTAHIMLKTTLNELEVHLTQPSVKTADLINAANLLYRIYREEEGEKAAFDPNDPVEKLFGKIHSNLKSIANG